MGSSGNDSDLDPGPEDGVSEETHEISESTITSNEDEVHKEGGRNGRNTTTNPERLAQTRVTEKTVRITETRTKNIQGLDDLSSAVNSLDDHVQAGLQEIRNCVASLHLERTELRKHVRTLSDEIRRVSADKDKYHHAVTDLQQEILALRNQLHNEQQKNEEIGRKMQHMQAREEEISAIQIQLHNEQQKNDEMVKKMQHMQAREERHLLRIAGRTRSQRLAKSAFSVWRKKVLQKNYGSTIQVLEEENSHLRAELLLCQEAAKQAFLRSATALNSEAITMFQDAATRRLGLEENEDQGSLSPKSSSSSSSRANQQQKNDTESVPANKENAGRFRDRRDYSKGEKRTRGDDKGSHGDFGSAGLSSVGLGKGHRYQRTDHGAILKKKTVISDFVPDSLRQETRAFLQQLRDERMNRPEPTIASGFEPQRTMQKGLSSSQDSTYTKTCHCRSTGAKSNHTPAPYKCPYCTPIKNSSFGHVKDHAKKKPEINETPKVNHVSSNITRSVILSGTTAEKKKVVYKPSASTVIIEKHINK